MNQGEIKMELDKRIEKLSDILTCFDIQKAGQFLGHEGYFADVNSSYQSLDNKAYGVLTEIKDAAYPFKMNNNDYWRFFIPEIRLKPVEKKYRPCTLDDFCLNIGDLIKFRRKDDHNFEVGTMYMGYRKNGDVKVQLGAIYYSLKELFEDYEWFDGDSNTWEPFGVEE